MNIKALQIGKHLEESGISPVYVLCGEDDSLISASLSALRKCNETGDMPGSTSVEFDELDDARVIFDQLYTRPFLGMAGRRMVIARCGGELAEAAPDQLAEYSKDPASFSVLVLCCTKLDRRKNPGRELARSAVWVDCSKIRWNDARQWVREEARRQGKRLDSGLDYALVRAVGPHISALKEELEKLVLYTGKRKVIDRRAMEEIVPASRSRTVFELSDAIARSDAREAVALSETLLLYGEAPEMIIAFLGSRMRQLWQIARLARERTPPRTIAKEVGVPDFAVKKALESVRKRDERWFAGRIKILAEADSELKTSSLPSRARPRWMTAVVLRLCE